MPTQIPHAMAAVGSGVGIWDMCPNHFEQMSVSIGSCFSKLHIGSFFKVSGFAKGCRMPSVRLTSVSAAAPVRMTEIEDGSVLRGGNASSLQGVTNSSSVQSNKA